MPLIVRSAYRSPKHDRPVGGATRSKHMDGADFDLSMANHAPVTFEAVAREVGSSASASTRAWGLCILILGPHASGATGSRCDRWHLQCKRRPQGKCWPKTGQ
nr:D-Ala-D-Ala carboxypeptidase family metallohydrolase [Paracoccus salipaludis]